MISYRCTKSFPKSEMFGLASQIRRAAVSTATDIVEGAQRATLKDYLHFLDMGLGSLAELGYLMEVAHRLSYVEPVDYDAFRGKHDECIKSLRALIDSLRKS